MWLFASFFMFPSSAGARSTFSFVRACGVDLRPSLCTYMSDRMIKNTRKPYGYWKKVENQKSFLADLSQTLCITKDEDWFSVNASTFRKYGGGSLITQYSSIKEMFEVLLPGSDWNAIFALTTKKKVKRSLLVKESPGIPLESVGKSKTKAPGKALMLSQVWNDSIDPTGYWISEKFDGCRAFWSGEVLVSRYGKPLHAPKWFLDNLPPNVPLDGELWAGYNCFGKLMKLLRAPDHEEWKDCRLMVFDSPDESKNFEERIEYVRDNVKENDSVKVVPYVLCKDGDHLKEVLKEVVDKKGEGLMLRKAEAGYDVGRSYNMLKVKIQQDAEVKMVKKASKCMGFDTLLPNDVLITIRCTSTDFKHAPPPGTILKVKHFGEWEGSGKLKNPFFWRIRNDGTTWEDIVTQYYEDREF